ncbi:MAG: ATP synthase subunit I [Rhodoferax sp.]|nr:ATP synthase subunit I [Rhodoferax sp.]
MLTIPPGSQSDEDPVFTPLTAEQAKALRKQHPALSPWWVVLGQLVVGVLVALIAWGVTGQSIIGLSAACGALAVVLPAALFARGITGGLTGRFASVNVGSAVLGFFVWELVKILLTVVVMFAAHRLVKGLNWPVMLLGLVLTMKVYWLALGYKHKPKPVQV